MEEIIVDIFCLCLIEINIMFVIIIKMYKLSMILVMNKIFMKYLKI